MDGAGYFVSSFDYCRTVTLQIAAQMQDESRYRRDDIAMRREEGDVDYNDCLREHCFGCCYDCFAAVAVVWTQRL